MRDELSIHKFCDWLYDRMPAHEGGGPSVSIGYDDATFKYIITQKQGNNESKILGCGGSILHAMELAVSGKVFD